MGPALVIDGQNLAFAANMTRPLADRNGNPTQAILAFFRMVGGAIEKFDATDAFVTWDSGRSPERLKLFPGYKANREAKKADPDYMQKREELKWQIKFISATCQLLGVKQILGPDIEGDDAIALIIKVINSFTNLNAVIVSADKDFWQLVDGRVSVFNPVNNGSKVKHVTLDNFAEATGGLNPRQHLDFKAMVGDPSDGIPGCKGVGEKTALKILEKFGWFDKFVSLIERGEHTPKGLEKRAFDDTLGFYTARKLIDLKDPLIGQSGQGRVDYQTPDFSMAKRAFQSLDFTTGNSIVEDFERMLQKDSQKAA